MIELLCSYGADVNLKSRSDESALSLILNCAQKRALKFSTSGSSLKTSASHSGKNFWVPVAQLLVRRGALWDPALRDKNGRTQLHLLFSGPAPPKKDFASLAYLVKSALHAGLDLRAIDNQGKSSLELAELQGARSLFPSTI